MRPKETILSGAPHRCPSCRVCAPFEVLKSAAGYYIGTQCKCGPYTRESIYYSSREEAEEDLREYRRTGWFSGIRY